MNGRHGHISPNDNGFKANCGGPAKCRECQREAAVKLGWYSPEEFASAIRGLESLLYEAADRAKAAEARAEAAEYTAAKLAPRDSGWSPCEIYI